MAKIKCRLGRDYFGDYYLEGDGWETNNFCERDFRKMCPALAKGLRKGKSRKCILTQTNKGIKIERSDQ